MYSTEWTQPNTKADPESGLGVRFGSALSPLFKKGQLGVCSESARGLLCVSSWGSALRTHAGNSFLESCLNCSVNGSNLLA